MKKNDVNIYPRNGVYYATYRTKINDPERGEITVQRNISTGLGNQLLAQKWANNKQQEEFREFLRGTETKVKGHNMTCGKIIACYLKNCCQTSAKKTVKDFCILVAEGLGQFNLEPKEREKFVRAVQLSALSANHLADWKEQNLRGKRTPANIHAIMRTGKGIFAQTALDYYRKLPSFGRDYPVNIKEWKGVSKPAPMRGKDESFQSIDERILAKMDRLACKERPYRSMMLRLSRGYQRLGGNDAESVRWRNAYAAYWLIRRCGLRNIEVENLRWEWFEVGQNGINLVLVTRPYWKPKQTGGRVPVAQDLYATLLEVFGPTRPGADGYVLHGEARDRYEGVNEFVNKFVRRCLPDRPKGVYELRKQFGSEIAAKYGIETAARLLRHKGLETAYRHYYTPLKGVEPL